MNSARTSCACATCQSACQNEPGSLEPTDLPRLAAYLGISMRTLFRRFLRVVPLYNRGRWVFVLSPAVVGEPAGGEAPCPRDGCCVFFSEGRCTVYAARPWGCREYLHTDTKADHRRRAAQLAEAWQPAQPLVTELLGWEPEPSCHEACG